MEINIKNGILILEGVILLGDYDKVFILLEHYPQDKLLYVLISSKGGNVSAAIKISRLLCIYDTIIYAHNYVDSAAILILIVGKKRFATSETTTFLMHNPQDKNGHEASPEFIAAQAGYISEYTFLHKNGVMELMKKNININIMNAIQMNIVQGIQNFHIIE